jgi:hypothetical protein
MLTFDRKVKSFITPNNSPDGGVYHASAFPQINFVISSSPGAYIDPRTLRLQGKYRLVRDNAGVQQLPQNVTDGTAGNADNGAATNPYVGIHGCIDEVLISTLNGRTIESIRSYNHYVATTRPFYTSVADVNNGGNLYDASYQVKSTTNALTVNQETDFAIQLRTGLFQNNIIPVSEKGMHGLNITLSLAQNANQIQPFYIYDPSVPSGTAVKSTESYRYELFDLALTFDTLYASASLQAAIPSNGMLQFNTVQTLHSTLLSSDQTLNLRFGSNNTLAVTHSMIPSVNLNNQAVDSLRLCEPENGPIQANGRGTLAPVTTVNYMKSGRMFPYDFELNSEAQALDGRPKSMIVEPAQNSVTLYQNEDSMLSTMTFNGLSSGRMNIVKDVPHPYPTLPDPRSLFILGVPFDSARTGVSFKNDQYSVRIQSGLNQRSPMSFFTFTLARNIVQYSPSGIMVLE